MAEDQRDDGYFEELLHRHLSFIENESYRAVRAQKPRNPSGLEDVKKANEADALYLEVLEHLTENHFEALRKYAGRTSMEGYLRAIISKRQVDRLRRMAGRDRTKAKAKEQGLLGARIYDLWAEKGQNLESIQEILKPEGIPAERIEAVYEAIRSGRKHIPRETSITSDSDTPDDHGEWELPDLSADPEALVLQKEKVSSEEKMFQTIAATLKPEEMLIIRMRYQSDLAVNAIAATLGMEEKTVYTRIRRILVRCKEALLKEGLPG